MIVAGQIRAARALLRWSAQKLANESGVSWTTIQRIEATDGVPAARAKSLVAIQEALEAGGISFIDEDDEGPGVRLRKGHLKGLN
jgi:DNA-binding Xre family transcriptional regulator